MATAREVARGRPSRRRSGVTRTYTDWATITREVIDARVWEGVHFRSSDEAGTRLGKQVGSYDPRRLSELGI